MSDKKTVWLEAGFVQNLFSQKDKLLRTYCQASTLMIMRQYNLINQSINLLFCSKKLTY